MRFNAARIALVIFLAWVFYNLPLRAQVTNPEFKLVLEKIYRKTVPLVSVQEAANLQNQQKAVVFLDTRELEEYKISHIKDARWVGYHDFNIQRLTNVPKQSQVIVYCSVGYRSEKIGERLQKAGYQDVQNLYGSIFEWVNQGYPVYKNQNQTTSKVHAYNRNWGKWLQKGKKVY